MKIHRFFVDIDLSQDIVSLKDREFVHQIKNVLHLRVGEKIELADNHMREATAEITDFDKNSVVLKISSLRENNRELTCYFILYCAVLKREHFEMVVEKATEIGVKEIYPLRTARTIKLGLNKKRLEKIAKEAAEQSGRGIIPAVNSLVDFDDAREAARGNDINLFFDGSGGALPDTGGQAKKIGIFIGPEGGWDEKELDAARASGFIVSSLGKLTFRAETAAIVALYHTSLLN